MDIIEALETCSTDLLAEFEEVEVHHLPAKTVTKSVQECEEQVKKILMEVVDGFCFKDQAKLLSSDPAKVSQFSTLLKAQLESCVVMKSQVKGVNREASQTQFCKLMASGIPELTAVSGDHRLTTWISMSVFEDFCRTPSDSSLSPSPPDSSSVTLSTEEADVSHYIGGFVCCKLKKRSKCQSYTDAIQTLISDQQPDPETLIAAKSRGRLTNLTKDGQCIFVELETLFQVIFPPSVHHVQVTEYKIACINNIIVQDCFHSATDHISSESKDEVLSDIILLYFKVRVNQKCKKIIENIRSKKRTSKQEKALRSKLAK